MSSMEPLESFLAGEWKRGDSVESELSNPVTGEVLATAAARGLDLKGALQYSRTVGRAGLYSLSYAARAKLLGDIGDVLVANRGRYEAIAIANSGNTKTDAAIDIDGGIGTLKYYARLGASLGDNRALLDAKAVRLTKSETFEAIHLLVPRSGAAVHINAFNFPSWGLWEKAAVSLLAGVPVLAKPASSTALLAHAMVRDVVAANVLPQGALSLLVGGIGNLLDHLDAEDVVAFTGSSDTAARVRSHPNIVGRNIAVNIESDSLNAAILAPGIGAGSAMFDAFVREVVREMTTKAGQKCTAIRRILVPAEVADAVAQAIIAKLRGVVIGDPRQDGVQLGPVVTRAQQRAAFEGIRHLATESKILSGGFEAPRLDGIDREKSSFVSPTLLLTNDAMRAQAVHLVEVFGPAATVIPYRNDTDAFALVRRGAGSLVASVFGEDSAFLAHAASEIASAHGRLLIVDPSIINAHTGHGIVMPQCNHGGPGRAGNGEELGGLSGLRLYHQRVAIQGSSQQLRQLDGRAAPLH